VQFVSIGVISVNVSSQLLSILGQMGVPVQLKGLVGMHESVSKQLELFLIKYIFLYSVAIDA